MKVIRYPETGEDKVKRILVLIKNGNLDMDGTPEEILEREPFAELVDDLNLLQNKVKSLEARNVEKIQEEVDRKILEQKRLTEVCVNRIDTLSNTFSAKCKTNENSITIISRELKDKVETLQHQQSVLEAQNVEKFMKIQSTKEKVDRKILEQEKLTEVCVNRIETLCKKDEMISRELQDVRGYFSDMTREMVEVRKKLKKAKISIGNLASVSFTHMLVMSFFVSAELLPTHAAFRDESVHPILYAMAASFQAFFVSVFFIGGVPSHEFSTEYLGLMIANLIFASLMAAMIHRFLCMFTLIWWLLWTAVMYCRIPSDELGSKDKKEEIIKYLAAQG